METGYTEKAIYRNLQKKDGN